MICCTPSDLVFALTAAAHYAEERGAYTIAVCNLPPAAQDEATAAIVRLLDSSEPSTVEALAPSWLALEDALAEVRSWREEWAAEGSTGNTAA